MSESINKIVNLNGLDIMVEYEKKNDIPSKLRMLRFYAGMNRKEFAEYLHIPYRTMTEWERGTRQMPDYVMELISYKVFNEKKAGRI